MVQRVFVWFSEIEVSKNREAFSSYSRVKYGYRINIKEARMSLHYSKQKNRDSRISISYVNQPIVSKSRGVLWVSFFEPENDELYQFLRNPSYL